MFDAYPTPRQYQTFVNLFLTEPPFRQQYLVQGTWTGTLICETDTGFLLNPVCLAGIQRLNALKSPLSFQDFSCLKTGGRDGVSHLTLGQLTMLLPPEAYTLAQAKAKRYRWERKSLLACLRWMVRGLRPQLAVQKVNVDLTRQAEAMKGSSNRYHVLE